jgi:hypothetical protein
MARGRQHHREDRPARCARHPDRAAVLFDDRFCDRQAEAAALGAIGSGCVDLVEAIEHVAKMVG